MVRILTKGNFGPDFFFKLRLALGVCKPFSARMIECVRYRVWRLSSGVAIASGEETDDPDQYHSADEGD